jgi:hypothetical protein
MPITEQFLAKAAEYKELIAHATDPGTIREFQQLERSFTELANNAAWLADNLDKTLRPGENEGGYGVVFAPPLDAGRAEERDADFAHDEGLILRRLGAAVIVRWNALPKSLRKQLFDSASSMKDPLQTGALKGQIARFLHKHKNDEVKRWERSRRTGRC